MKKTASKISFILVFMILMLCSLCVHAETGTYKGLSYSVSNGEITITGCDNSLTSVVIPSEIKVSNIYPVTKIGREAFANCINLESITIPGSVTEIYPYAFNSCSNLKDVYTPSLNDWLNISFSPYVSDYTSNPLYNGANLYINGDLATDVIIPDGFTSIACSFTGCTSITSITIPEGVTTIDRYAFINCTSLKSVTLPSSLTDIGYMAFYGCTNIESVFIPDLKAWCSIKVDEWSTPLNGANGTDLYINNVLAENIVIPDDVTEVAECAFYGCASIETITIPESVTSVGKKAFSCPNLYSVDAVSFESWCNIEFETEETNPVNNGANLFIDGKMLLSHITVTKNISSLENVKNCTITSATIEKAVTDISPGLFSGFNSLQTITIPSSVTEIGKEAFKDCIYLSKVYISNLESWCKIKFADAYSNPLYYAGNLYINGTIAADIVIPEGITRLEQFAFFNCDSLTSVKIPDTLTFIGQEAFRDCDNLTHVNIPKSVTEIQSWAFCGLENPKTISAPVSLRTITNEWFEKGVTNVTYYCTVQYSLQGEIIGTERVNYGENAVNIPSHTDYNYVCTVDSNAWTGTNITKDYLVSLSRSCTVTFEGDYSEKREISYGDSLPLPTCAEEGRYYKFTVDEEVLENTEELKNITKHTTVLVEKIKNSYTVTFDGAISKEEKVFHGDSLTLPSCSEDGYVYQFSIDGENLENTETIENITQSFLVTVTKQLKTYTISYEGAVSETENKTVTHGEDVLLPLCSNYGYYYTYTVNGASWGEKAVIENVTQNYTVLVTKVKKEYTVTYTGDKTATETVKYLESAKRFTAPYGYIYKYSTDTEENWSGVVTENVSVTVTLLCDLCEIEDFTTLHDWTINENEIVSSSFNAYLDIKDITFSEKTSAQFFADESCRTPIINNIVSMPKKETSYVTEAYLKVTAESGKSKVYKLLVTRNYITDIEFLSTGSGTGKTIVLQLSTAIYSEPVIQYNISGNTSYEWNIVDSNNVEFNRKLQILKFTLPSFNTDYDVRIIADYGDAEPVVSHAEGVRTKQSNECDFTVIKPSNATVDHDKKTIYKKLENFYETSEIELSVSVGASWELYADKNCTNKISSHELSLCAGEDTEAYIKIIAEDGYTSKTYKLILYRASRSASPVISSDADGKITFSAPKGSEIVYTTNGQNPTYGIDKSYYGPFYLPKGSYQIKAIARAPQDDEFSNSTASYAFISTASLILECNDLTQVTNGVKWAVSVISSNDIPVCGTLFVAAYNSEHTFLGFQPFYLDSEESTTSISNTFRSYETPAYLKIFFWEYADNYNPICPNLIVTP